MECSENAQLYAFNGNKYTDGTPYNEGENECPIYCQAGIILAKYDFEGYEDYTGDGYVKTNIKLVLSQTNINLTGYINKDSNVNKIITLNTSEDAITFNLNTQGIGSGAGYIEVSNGTFEVISEE